MAESGGAGLVSSDGSSEGSSDGAGDGTADCVKDGARRAADRLGGDRDHLACRALHAAVLAPQTTEQAFTNPLTLLLDPNGPAPTFLA